MSDIGIFDVLGPNMIGPSSSHTAGALRIALMTGKMVESRPVEVTFTLYGSFAKTYRGHGTDRALLAGILGFGTEDIRIRDSFRLADEAGLRYHFIPDSETKDVHPNTVKISLLCENRKKIEVVGVSVGGGRVSIRKINGIEVDFSGEYVTLIVEHTDRPGTVAYITSWLSNYHVNIAFMRLYREQKGERAYCIIEVDGRIPKELLQHISEYPSVSNTTLLNLV